MNKNFFRDNAALIKALKTELAAAGLIIMASAVFFKFVYLHGRKTLQEADAGIMTIKAEMDRVGAGIKAGEDLKKSVVEADARVRLLDARLKNLRERLPSDKRMARILAEVTAGGAGKNLRVAAVKPLPPEDRGELIRLPFQLSVETGFFAFGDYIEMIEGMPRIIVVDNFMIERTGETGSALTAQIYFSAYALSYGG
ncbi:MAG: type 4a pilus biogenesis protein PilO [Deltaproteobacteria bacterium]|nr:type 4a pilus biogenesis protein PilO [Deltaproteobacteria bacterium]